MSIRLDSVDTQLTALADHCREEALSLLRQMIAFDSRGIEQGVRGNEGKAQQFMAAQLRKLGAAVDVFEPDNRRIKKYADFNPGHDYHGRPNVAATFKGRGGGKSLILNGHIDTVSAGDVSAWKHDPYGGEIENGRLIGLGAVDMKGGLAAMLMAMRIIKRAGIKLRGDVIFQSVVDEEGGGNGTLACVERGYKADAALIAEPTSLAICCAHRGAMHAGIQVRGLTTHASLKSKGVNAIEKMMLILGALEDLNRQWQVSKKHALLPSPAITCCQIAGGTGASIIPAACEAKINVKYLPAENAPDVRAEVEKRVRDSARRDKWLKKNPPQIIWLLNTPPYETSTAHPLVSVLRRTIAGLKGKPKITGLPSGADARILNNIGKTPSFIAGPGELAQAHHIDEALPIAEYLQSIKIFAVAICRWAETN
ncbi:MAG: ArgE/DapE family deacylase [Kiritimatiellae bacterium]|nr:ArgE/DapE family deacylase [Kiritimatiellia bacterium]